MPEDYDIDLLGDDDDVDDLLGDLDDDEMDDLLGALPRSARARLRAMRRRARIRSRYRRAAGIRSLARADIAPGVGRHKRGRLVMGLGTATFGATDTTAELEQEPQRNIKVERVVLVTVEDGAVAAGVELVEDIKVGTQSQLASSGEVPVAVFGPGSFDVELNGDVAGPGVKVSVPLSRTAAPGAGTSVTVAGAIIGAAVV